MKQLTHSLLDREIYFIEVPKDAYDYEIIGATSGSTSLTDLWYSVGDNHLNDICIDKYNNIEKKIEIICEYPGTIEEQAAKVVGDKGEDFEMGGFMFDTATESLQSLVKSLDIFTENPLGERPSMEYFAETEEMFNDGHAALEQWQAAQSKVWEKILILTNK